MVTKFQRTSSPVEGRNGYLSQIHHNRRGLSTRRLRVMTTIHNFHLQRSDGSTAAERLFGKPSPDLFQWVGSTDARPPASAAGAKLLPKLELSPYPLSRLKSVAENEMKQAV